jgi:hypothetical protein
VPATCTGGAKRTHSIQTELDRWSSATRAPAQNEAVEPTRMLGSAGQYAAAQNENIAPGGEHLPAPERVLLVRTKPTRLDDVSSRNFRPLKDLRPNDRRRRRGQAVFGRDERSHGEGVERRTELSPAGWR